MLYVGCSTIVSTALLSLVTFAITVLRHEPLVQACCHRRHCRRRHRHEPLAQSFSIAAALYLPFSQASHFSLEIISCVSASRHMTNCAISSLVTQRSVPPSRGMIWRCARTICASSIWIVLFLPSALGALVVARVGSLISRVVWTEDQRQMLSCFGQ